MISVGGGETATPEEEAEDAAAEVEDAAACCCSERCAIRQIDRDSNARNVAPPFDGVYQEEGIPVSGRLHLGIARLDGTVEHGINTRSVETSRFFLSPFFRFSGGHLQDASLASRHSTRPSLRRAAEWRKRPRRSYRFLNP